MSTSIGHSPNDLEAQVTEASATQSTTRPTIADEGTSTTSSPVSDPENTANDGFVESASSRPWDRPYDGFEVCTTSDIAPPPYRASMSIDPPEYTRHAEPETLAMYLFKFGFRAFPPLPCLFIKLTFTLSISAILGSGSSYTRLTAEGSGICTVVAVLQRRADRVAPRENGSRTTGDIGADAEGRDEVGVAVPCGPSPCGGRRFRDWSCGMGYQESLRVSAD